MTDEHAAAVQAEVIATGVQNGIEASGDKIKAAKIKLNDRRMLILFVLVVVFVVLSLLWQEHTTNNTRSAQHHLAAAQAQIAQQQKQIIAAQHAAVVVCQATDTANASTRSVLDQLAANIRNSTAQTPEQKAAALAVYAHLALGFPNIDCSHLAGS